jgi:hypothetical protein
LIGVVYLYLNVKIVATRQFNVARQVEGFTTPNIHIPRTGLPERGEHVWGPYIETKFGFRI